MKIEVKSKEDFIERRLRRQKNFLQWLKLNRSQKGIPEIFFRIKNSEFCDSVGLGIDPDELFDLVNKGYLSYGTVVVGRFSYSKFTVLRTFS
jgi:hypothetical protein